MLYEFCFGALTVHQLNLPRLYKKKSIEKNRYITSSSAKQRDNITRYNKRQQKHENVIQD